MSDGMTDTRGQSESKQISPVELSDKCASDFFRMLVQRPEFADTKIADLQQLYQILGLRVFALAVDS